jgi:hypothetical protein
VALSQSQWPQLILFSLGVVREAVLEVSDYYDGPREGVAMLHSAPYRFRSRRLDTTQYRGDIEAADIFELTPLSSPGSPPILAHATFHAVPQEPEPPSGILTKLEVIWQVFSEPDT